MEGVEVRDLDFSGGASLEKVVIPTFSSLKPLKSQSFTHSLLPK